MSAVASGGKSNRCQIKPNTEQGSARVGNSSPGRERTGGFQDTRRKKRVTRAPPDCARAAQNVRVRTFAQSGEECVSTARDQIHFTSFFSLAFPSTRSDGRGGKVRVTTKLRRDSDAKGAAVQPEDLRVSATIKASSGTTSQDEDVPNSQNGDPVYPWGPHVEHGLSSRGCSDGIQRGLAACDRGQLADVCARGRSTGRRDVTGGRVADSKCVEGQSGDNEPLEQNEERTVSHTNIIAFREDTGPKVDPDCHVHTCSLTAINQALSLPSFPDPHYAHNPKSDLVGSTAVMFTSTLVSVLAPHWTGRFRRHKPGFSDAGQDIAENTNLYASAQQQSFPLQRIQGRGEAGNNFSPGLSRSSVESFSHLSESSKLFPKTSSLRMASYALEQTAQSGNSLRMATDRREVPRSTTSLQLSNYRQTAQSVDRGDAFLTHRSRPTTSTLLLSSRRMNSRKPSHESSQMHKPLSTSIGSLNTPCRSILRISQPQNNLASSNDPTLLTKSTFGPCENLSVTHKPEPTSGDSSSKHRYVITGDFDTINRSPPATERPFSNYSTRFHQPDPRKSAQGPAGADPNLTDNKHVQDSNSNVPERSVWISQQENANSRFVFPQIPSNLNSDRRIPTASASLQASSINNMINSNLTGAINSPTSPGMIQSYISSPPVPNQNNSCSPDKLFSPSPVNSVRTRTFTESLSVSPRKDSTVEGTSPSQTWSESPSDQPSPLSPSDFKPRRVCTPSIYKYLRESSPPKSTQTSPAPSSPNPPISSPKDLQNSRDFTFDSHGPGSRLSKSPYSTLISTRAAGNGLSSPPLTHQHTRSYSYGSSPVDEKSPKRSYTSVLRDRLSQRRSLADSCDLQVPTKTVSFRQDGISESSTEAKLSDCQAATLIPDATHLKQTDALGKYSPHEGRNGIFLSDKSNTCTPDRLNSKVPQVTSLVTEAPRKGGESEPNGRFEADQSPNLKRSIFSLRSKKDTVLTSSAEGLAVNNRETIGPKTIKRMDQVLNRLRLKFGGKISDEGETKSKRKTKKDEVKSYDSLMKEKQPNVRNEDSLDSKATEWTGELDQTDPRTLGTRNKADEVLGSKATPINPVVDLTVRRPVECLDTEGFDRNRNLGDKPKDVLDIEGPETSGKLDQSETVRRKIKNALRLDSTMVDRGLSVSPSLKSPQTSPRSPNPQVTSSPALARCHITQNAPIISDQKRLTEVSGNRHLARPVSPNWPKPDNITRYATLPPGRRSRLVPSPILSPFECFLEDEQSDSVFLSSDFAKRNLGESDGGILSSALHEADIKYGLHRGRSVSVSSVVSGRPSGPGRISTGSRQSSVSDLSSLDSFASKSRHSSFNSSPGSPENDGATSSGHASNKGPTGRRPSEGRLRSPDSQDASSFSWDMEADPTPPPSPLQNRRISQISSPSSGSSRSSPDSVSPRGLLPSRSYKSTLSVFEESDSESSTDGEYYLDSDDGEKETEL